MEVCLSILNKIDTFGFSLHKLINLLVVIKPLEENLMYIILDSCNNALIYSKENGLIKSQEIIIHFIYKLLFLIFIKLFFLLKNI